MGRRIIWMSILRAAYRGGFVKIRCRLFQPIKHLSVEAGKLRESVLLRAFLTAKRDLADL